MFAKKPKAPTAADDARTLTESVRLAAQQPEGSHVAPLMLVVPSREDVLKLEVGSQAFTREGAVKKVTSIVDRKTLDSGRLSVTFYAYGLERSSQVLTLWVEGQVVRTGQLTQELHAQGYAAIEAAVDRARRMTDDDVPADDAPPTDRPADLAAPGDGDRRRSGFPLVELPSPEHLDQLRTARVGVVSVAKHAQP
jgi:hypothetical protein